MFWECDNKTGAMTPREATDSDNTEDQFLSPVYACWTMYRCACAHVYMMCASFAKCVYYLLSRVAGEHHCQGTGSMRPTLLMSAAPSRCECDSELLNGNGFKLRVGDAAREDDGRGRQITVGSVAAFARKCACARMSAHACTRRDADQMDVYCDCMNCAHRGMPEDECGSESEDESQDESEDESEDESTGKAVGAKSDGLDVAVKVPS